MPLLLLLVSFLSLVPVSVSVSVYDHLYYLDQDIQAFGFAGVCNPPHTMCNLGFSYNRTNPCFGPDAWSNISTCYVSCNHGRQQSPINILSSQSYFLPDLPSIVLRPEYTVVTTNTTNKQNRAPEFQSYSVNKPVIDLHHPVLSRGVFGFENIHLHIGQFPSRGSEHSIDDRHSPLEAHLVFTNKAVSSSLSVARTHSEGLLVIGVMLLIPSNTIEDIIAFGPRPTASECGRILGKSGHFSYNGAMSDPFYKSDPLSRLGGRSDSFYSQYMLREGMRASGRCPITRAPRLSRVLECAYRHNEVRQFKEPGCNGQLYVDLLPEDSLPVSRQYYAYKGSLTTPPCTENVQWIVMRCPVQVSRRVLFSLRFVEGYRDRRTLSTFGVRRPLQTNVNPVYNNFFNL